MRRFEIEFDPAALDDLAALRDHITETSSKSIADVFVDRFLDHLDGFGVAPKRGARRDDIRPGLRTVGWRRILTVAFIVNDSAGKIAVVGVLYRGRDVESALKRRFP